MDYPHLLRLPGDTFGWLMPALFLIGLLTSPWVRGQFGELAGQKA